MFLQVDFLQCKSRHLTRSMMRQTSLFLTKACPIAKAFECNSFILPIAFLMVNIDRMFSLLILKTMRLIGFRRILETYRKHISNELVVWHLWRKTAGSLRQYLPLQFETLCHEFCLRCSSWKGNISVSFIHGTIN